MLDPTLINTTEDLDTHQDELIDWSTSLSLQGSSWQEFRRVYKLVETSRNPRVISSFLGRIDREVFDQCAYPTAASLKYFKRRGFRYLKRLSKDSPELLTSVALHLITENVHGEHDLATHRWIAYGILHGSLSSGRVRITRHGRGNLVMDRVRPTMQDAQDLLPIEPENEVATFQHILKTTDLPWQVYEAAAIRLRKAETRPSTAQSLYEASMKSPSPLLRQVAVECVLDRSFRLSNISASSFFECFYTANSIRRKHILELLSEAEVPTEWADALAKLILQKLLLRWTQHARYTDCFKLLLALHKDKQLRVSLGSFLSVLESVPRVRRIDVAKLIAAHRIHLPANKELHFALVHSKQKWLRLSGWWLVAKQSLQPSEIHQLWRSLLAEASISLTDTLTGSLAMASLECSAQAKDAVLSRLECDPNEVVSLLQVGQLKTTRIGLQALSRKPKRVKELISKLALGLPDDDLMDAIKALLQSISRQKNYWPIIEELSTSYNPSVCTAFWQWCCDKENEEWLTEHAEMLGRVADWDSAHVFEREPGIAMQLAKVGFLTASEFSFPESIESGLMLAFDTKSVEHLLGFAMFSSDDCWQDHEDDFSCVIRDNDSLEIAFWGIALNQTEENPSFFDRITNSDALKESLAALRDPSFLNRPELEIVPLIRIWLDSNPTALDNLEQCRAVAQNSNYEIRGLAVDKLRNLRLPTSLILELAELGYADTVELARDQVDAKWSQMDAIPETLLLLLESPSPTARALGWQYFSRLDSRNEMSEILVLLAESEDEETIQRIWPLLVSSGKFPHLLLELQRRTLCSFRYSRMVKEMVKQWDDVALNPQDRNASLEQIAVAGSQVDRDWALVRLVDAAQSGAVIPGIEVINEGSI